MLLAGPFNLCPAIASGLDLDRDGLVADITPQLIDGARMVAIEAVCDAKDGGEPLDNLTPVGSSDANCRCREASGSAFV